VAHGIARFLAVESCGQCLPCKDDGLAIARALDALRASNSDERTLRDLTRRFATVTDGARCGLAGQQSAAVHSLLRLGAATAQGHLDGRLEEAAPYLVAPIVDLVDGAVSVDADYGAKQPDWTYDDTDSGSSPAELYADTPVRVT
jgi:hypothetical protein